MHAPRTMVALGDSIGYGLSAFPDPANRDNSTLSGFNDQLAAFLGIEGRDYVNLACPGDKTSDLLAKLDRSDFKSKICRADILTVSIGGNNILGPFVEAICRLWGLTPEDYVHAPNRSVFADLKDAIAVKAAAMPDYQPGQDFARLANLRDPAAVACRIALIRGIFAFSREWSKIVGQIRLLNNHAELYVLTVPSPGLIGNPADTFHAFYVAIESLTRAINRVIRKHAASGHYEIVDLNQACRSIPGTLTFNIAGAVDAAAAMMQADPGDSAYPAMVCRFQELADFHPSYAGHVAAFEILKSTHQAWVQQQQEMKRAFDVDEFTGPF